MDLATSFAATSFRKVLKGFEIGGLPYTDVQFHLRAFVGGGHSAGRIAGSAAAL